MKTTHHVKTPYYVTVHGHIGRLKHDHETGYWVDADDCYDLAIDDSPLGLPDPHATGYDTWLIITYSKLDADAILAGILMTRKWVGNMLGMVDAKLD